VNAQSELNVPNVIAILAKDDSARWSHSMPGGKTRRDIIARAIIAAAGQGSQSGHDKLRELIETEFRSASPERADKLLENLNRAFTDRLDPAHKAVLKHWRDTFQENLFDWRNNHAFQPAPYHKLLVATWTNAIGIARDTSELNDCIDFVANAIADNFREAISTGQAYARENGSDAWASHRKVRIGLARHISVTLDAAGDFAQESRTGDRLAIAALCAASVAGLLEGVDACAFYDDVGVPVSPFTVMSAARESWEEVLSVLPLLSYSQRSLPRFVTKWLADNSLESNVLDGFWLAARMVSNTRDLPTICPIPRRAYVNGARIDFAIDAILPDNSRETVDVALFLTPVRSSRTIRDLLGPGNAVASFGLIICRQLLPTGDSLAESRLLTQIPVFPPDPTQPSAQRVADIVATSLATAVTSRVDVSIIQPKNFPSDFPLEEYAKLSDKYLVNRPSVETIVQGMLEKPGLYMCCGMRRGGKTTAFHATVLKRMLIPQDAALVETCRRQNLPSTFYPWLQKQFDDYGILSADALDDWFGVNLENRRLFVIDEYEHLFRWLLAVVQEKPTARTRFVDPLLDGFVRASERLGFLFLGFEPGAARIFMADNPLTPRIQLRSFPYFQHEPGSRTSEFAKFVQIVLTRHLEIDSSLLTDFAHSSGGHPHFTVSLLREFVGWMIERRLLKDKQLTVDLWPRFHKERLSPLVMRNSSWFNNYATVHQGLREDVNPWVRAVARLAERMGDEPLSFDAAVAHLMAISEQPADWAQTALFDGLTASVFSQDLATGSITVTVPAYGRLASSWRT
jgi:hypothetical protein